MPTGPDDSSGTVYTNEPFLSSVPSTPTHTTTEAISMPSLSKNDGGSKALEMVMPEDTETLPSVVHQFVSITFYFIHFGSNLLLCSFKFVLMMLACTAYVDF